MQKLLISSNFQINKKNIFFISNIYYGICFEKFECLNCKWKQVKSNAWKII